MFYSSVVRLIPPETTENLTEKSKMAVQGEFYPHRFDVMF